MYPFEHKVRAMKDEIQTRIANGKEGLVIVQASDPLDKAMNESNRDSQASQLERDRNMILALETALERMEEGTYGVCDRCDEPIALRRLECVPWAVMCRDCQEHQERTAGESKPTKRLIDHGRSIEAVSLRKATTEYV